MTTQTQSLTKTDPEKAIEFVPYGAADKIKLSVKIIQNMVAVPTKMGRTCSERDALRFLMLCQAQRLNPFAGDAFLVGYDTNNGGATFSLITAHQAFLKRAETCQDFEGMESGVIIKKEDGTIDEREGDFHEEEENVVGGWARVHRKNRKDTYRRIRMARFNTGFAQWKVDAAGMIVKCAEADALRSTFPTLLGGLYMQGEYDGAGSKIVAELSSSKSGGGFDPKMALVETTPANPAPLAEREPDRGDDTDLGPQRAIHAPGVNEAAETAVGQLQALVLSSGYTFSQLQKVGVETGLVDGADSIAGFDDISEANAKRLLRAKAGLLQKLAEAKGGE